MARDRKRVGTLRVAGKRLDAGAPPLAAAGCRQVVAHVGLTQQ